MNNSFCKDCPDRWVDTESGRTCHSVCEKYAKYKTDRILDAKKCRFNKAMLVTIASEKRHEQYKKRNKRNGI